MTSVLRHKAQTDPRTGFFIMLEGVAGYTLKATATLNPIMTVEEFNAAFDLTINKFSPALSYLLKDLGRQITVYQNTGLGSSEPGAHVALFRQVMAVQGPIGGEGISTNIAYICTWEDGSGTYAVASVARTG